MDFTHLKQQMANSIFHNENQSSDLKNVARRLLKFYDADTIEWIYRAAIQDHVSTYLDKPLELHNRLPKFLHDLIKIFILIKSHMNSQCMERHFKRAIEEKDLILGISPESSLYSIYCYAIGVVEFLHYQINNNQREVFIDANSSPNISNFH